MIYLAQPYTHSDPDVVRQRFIWGEHYTAELLQNKQWVYSPIVHCHKLAKRYNLPKDFAYWQDYNLHMLGNSHVMYALLLSGWKHSKGLFGEMKHAKALSIPFHYVEVREGKFINKAVDIRNIFTDFYPDARS